MMSVKRILVIAGSDSSGGAGLEADQKVIAAHGCYAMTATAALTAQNTLGVNGIHEVPSEFVKQQIDACIEDVGVDVVKTGMLASASTIRVVAATFKQYNVPTTIVDPVMVSTSGAQLLPNTAVKTLIEELLPSTTLLTPNLPEATLLLKEAGIQFKDPQVVDDIVNIATAVQGLGPSYVLLKGGHLPLTKERTVASSKQERAIIINVLVGKGETILFESPYLDSSNTHGTGCSLASAIACNIANEMDMPQAVKFATRYIEAGIRTSQNIGRGSGPINHFHSTRTALFTPGYFIEYLLDHKDVKPAWARYTEHAFVKQLADSTLPLAKFRRYLIQDYLFLIHFSRANALAAYKAKSLDDIARSASMVSSIQEEIKLHVEFCKEFGLSPEDIVQHEESQACTAYTRYVLDIGHSEDLLGLQIALLPCLLGYGVIAKRLFDDCGTVREGNRYWKWVETYVSQDYTDAVKKGSDLIEKYAIKQSNERIEELVAIFVHAVKMETGFWDMGIADD